MWNICCRETWLVGCIVNETEWIQQPFAILLFSNSDVNLVFPTSMDLKLELCNIEKSRKYTGYVPKIQVLLNERG